MHITLLDDYENLEIFANYVLNNYIKNEDTGSNSISDSIMEPLG